MDFFSGALILTSVFRVYSPSRLLRLYIRVLIVPICICLNLLRGS